MRAGARRRRAGRRPGCADPCTPSSTSSSGGSSTPSSTSSRLVACDLRRHPRHHALVAAAARHAVEALVPARASGARSARSAERRQVLRARVLRAPIEEDLQHRCRARWRSRASTAWKPKTMRVSLARSDSRLHVRRHEVDLALVSRSTRTTFTFTRSASR